MEVLVLLLILHTLMLPVSIVYLILGMFSKDKAQKAKYTAIGNKILIIYSIIFGLVILVGLGVCFVFMNNYN